MVKRVFLALLLVLVALAAAVAVNTWRTPSRQIAVASAPQLAIDVQAAAKRLAGAIPFRTARSQRASATPQ